MFRKELKRRGEFHKEEVMCAYFLVFGANTRSSLEVRYDDDSASMFYYMLRSATFHVGK